MIVGVLTTCHTQYTSDSSMCIFYLIEQHSKFLLHTLHFGVTEETSAHILCEGEALAALKHRYLGSFFLEPEGVKSISLGAIWSFSKAAGLP